MLLEQAEMDISPKHIQSTSRDLQLAVTQAWAGPGASSGSKRCWKSPESSAWSGIMFWKRVSAISSPPNHPVLG